MQRSPKRQSSDTTGNYLRLDTKANVLIFFRQNNAVELHVHRTKSLHAMSEMHHIPKSAGEIKLDSHPMVNQLNDIAIIEVTFIKEVHISVENYSTGSTGDGNRYTT